MRPDFRRDYLASLTAGTHGPPACAFVRCPGRQSGIPFVAPPGIGIFLIVFFLCSFESYGHLAC